MTKITSNDCPIIAWPGIIALQLDASRHLLIRLGGTPLPPLTIPTRLRPGIIRFAELPEESYTQLLAAIARAPECKDSKQLASWLADETPDISGPAREEIISSIASMYRVQKSSGVSPEEFAQDVWLPVLFHRYKMCTFFVVLHSGTILMMLGNYYDFAKCRSDIALPILYTL